MDTKKDYYGSDFVVRFISDKDDRLGRQIIARAIWIDDAGDEYIRGSASSRTRSQAMDKLFNSLKPEYKAFRLKVMKGTNVVSSMRYN